MDNPRIIHAPMNGRRYGVTAPITQYDYGYLLLPEGEELPTTYEVDFSNDEHKGTSLTVYGDSEGAEVPEELIRTGKDVFAFYYKVGEGYGKTDFTWRIPNHCRPDRDGGTPTPSQQSSIDQLIVRSNEAVEQAEQSASDASTSAQNASADAERAEEARTDAQNYATQAEQARDDAQTYANNASASATASAQSAEQSAINSADAQDSAEDAQGYAQASAQSASASANSASQASGYAQSASASAQSASGYASNAQTSANTASNKASEASTSAQTASTKASESAQSASQASGYAQTAESAKTDAQTAQGKAEDAQAAAESVAESIPSDYSQLSEDVSDLKEDLNNKVGEQLYNISDYVWNQSSFIKTGISVGSTVSMTPFSNGSYGYIVVPVKANDRFVVTTQGGGDPRAWAFTDESYKLLRNTVANYHAVDEVLVADQDGYLIVNSNVSETAKKLEKTDAETVTEYFEGLVGSQKYKETSLNWNTGAYIKTGVGANVAVDITPVTNNAYSYAIIPVLQGDVYKLTAQGGSEPRAWAFTDENYVLISKSAASYNAEKLVLTAPNNGYLIVNTSTRNKRFLAKIEKQTLSEAVEKVKTLKDYGAVGDGITDDTYAILYALKASQDKTLIIPDGTFLFSQTLTVFGGTRLIGHGEASVLKQASNFSYINYNWRGGNKKPLIILPSDTSRCVLHDFVLDGQTTQFDDWNIDGLTVMGSGHDIRNLTVSNIDYFPDQFSGRASSTPGMGIMCINASDVVVDNCNVYNCGYEAIGTESSENITISNCKVGDTNQTGIQIHRLSKYIKVTGNTVKYSDGKTNGSFTLHADENFDMSDIYIRDNYFGGSVVGVAGFENNIFIENNTINGNISQNNPVYAKNWIINGNNIYGRIYLRVDGLIIANNFLTVNNGYQMIYAYGYNRGISNNVGLGTVKSITENDRS